VTDFISKIFKTANTIPLWQLYKAFTKHRKIETIVFSGMQFANYLGFSSRRKAICED